MRVARRPDAEVGGWGESNSLLLDNHSNLRPLGRKPWRRAVARPVVHYDDLALYTARLVLQPGQELLQQGAAIARRNHDADALRQRGRKRPVFRRSGQAFSQCRRCRRRSRQQICQRTLERPGMEQSPRLCVDTAARLSLPADEVAASPGQVAKNLGRCTGTQRKVVQVLVETEHAAWVEHECGQAHRPIGHARLQDHCCPGDFDPAQFIADTGQILPDAPSWQVGDPLATGWREFADNTKAGADVDLLKFFEKRLDQIGRAGREADQDSLRARHIRSGSASREACGHGDDPATTPSPEDRRRSKRGSRNW